MEENVDERFTTSTEQLAKCCEPLQNMRARLGPCKTGLSPPPLSSSKAILLLWCYLFYVLESIFVLFDPYPRFDSLS